MEKHIRNWIPCSAFSKFSLGTLTGIVLDLIFPGTVLLWIGLMIFLFSLGRFLKKRFQISKYFIFGIFFLLYVLTSFPEKFQKNTQKKSFNISQKNPFGKPEKIFQEKFREQILLDLKEAKLEKNSNRIALGLIFGESKQLSQEFKTKAKEGGILHLFAASGLHLGILMGVQFRLLSLIPSLGYNLPRIIPLLTGFFYLSALGYPTSLARAWIFAGMLLFQGLFFRKLRPVDLLLGSAWILWLVDPTRFYSVSFCLSFGAVTGIFFFSYPIKIACNFLSDENKISYFLKENLSISFSAGLGTMPVLLFSFGSYSFGSVLLNLIMVPLAGILLPILYFSLLIQKTKLILLTEPIWSITEFLIQILIYLSENLSKPIGFYKEMKDTAWIGIAGWILLCIKIFYYSYFIEKNYLKDTEQSTENNVLNLHERFIESKTPNSQTLKREKPSLQNSILTKIKETTWENQNNLLNSMNKIFKNKINKPKNIDHKIQNLEYSTLYKPKTFRKIWYPIFCILFFLTTLGIHVLLYKSPDWFPQKNKIINNKFFFIFRNRDTLIFSGKCKYGFKTISNTFRSSKKIYCDSTEERPLKKVFVEDESCLNWAFQCLQDHPQTEIFYSGLDFEAWSQKSRFHFLKSKPIREISISHRSKILFFHTKKDSLFQLVQKTKTSSGWILLETPFGNKEDSKVWNRNRKLLGLTESWVFLEKDELQRIPISESF
ncbi:ComEC/Rec2 family competence protein [Leptospira noguchii]|uniref:ComEC/Rec2 family competence protein n=1 Tax=Leptospira noguchii TaxID=28182 RepID=UPI001FB5F136|nr:ComEC/Rec2 family competence protein [Leptospira noguchii]UOG34581.1 ComEC/Rec2 family competence protein [Leptospira noguchii]UOG45469.1 ComEC/Rec2 family competence protein [Leptospira noguchii]